MSGVGGIDKSDKWVGLEAFRGLEESLKVKGMWVYLKDKIGYKRLLEENEWNSIADMYIWSGWKSEVSSDILGDSGLEIIISDFLSEEIEFLEEFLFGIFGTSGIDEIENDSSLLHGEHLPILDVGTEYFFLGDLDSTFIELLEESWCEGTNDGILVLNFLVCWDNLFGFVVKFIIKFSSKICPSLSHFSSLLDVICVIDSSLQIAVFCAQYTLCEFWYEWRILISLLFFFQGLFEYFTLSFEIFLLQMGAVHRSHFLSLIYYSQQSWHGSFHLSKSALRTDLLVHFELILIVRLKCILFSQQNVPFWSYILIWQMRV